MNPQDFEKKWQEKWQETNIYATDFDSIKPKKYILDMFPYPSGNNLHVGHPRGYIATDVYSRYFRMKGFEVLHPMGFDAFGLGAEEYAMKNKTLPQHSVSKTIEMYKQQLIQMGVDYDWDNTLSTTDIEMYKWTQWIFLQCYKRGLAYESFEPINWCPSCKTGLANEDLNTDGTCERCGTKVEKKPLRQWVLKITDYADKLLDGIEALSAWPEFVKQSQRNWIGRSEGAEFSFDVVDETESSVGEKLTVFTTRADTLFGVTYIVVAPEHPLALSNVVTNRSEVDEYLEQTKDLSEIDRSNQNREKTGVQIEGVFAVHPATMEKVPVYVADYVIGSYGTGAVMGVPAHDERDFIFAKKYGLPIVVVVKNSTSEMIEGYCEDGTIEFNGVEISSEDARKIFTDSFGKNVVNYKIRDWTFSRQRYWGEPIPIVFDENHTAYPIHESCLPVMLPFVEFYEPTGTGESPLAGIPEFMNVKGYIAEDGSVVTLLEGENAPRGLEVKDFKRESNTMPGWAGSSWYYIRYLDNKNNDAFVRDERQKKWLPVDMYVGGVEHATRHLIYARFWHKVLFDAGLVSTREPFAALKNQGLIMASDGKKISKRHNNGANPSDVIANFGADAFRMFELFIAPFEQTTPWQEDGVVGTRRFLEKIHRFIITPHKEGDESVEVVKALHRSIKKVTHGIENFEFNTCVSDLMITFKVLEKSEGGVTVDTKMTLIKLLAPMAPYIAEEWYEFLGGTGSIHKAPWPEYYEQYLIEDEKMIAVQINGKVRGEVLVQINESEESVISKVHALESVIRYLDGQTIKKEMYIKGKIYTIVI